MPPGDPVTCICGVRNDRRLVAQCSSCGSDLWSLPSDGGPANGFVGEPVRKTIPRGDNLPATEPAMLETGFVEAQKAYDQKLRDRIDGVFDLSGSEIDASWQNMADTILTLHHWDPSTFVVEGLRIGVMRAKIQDWAARGGTVPPDELGWSHVLDAVEQFETYPAPADRDWSVGPIEIQHSEAIPVKYEYLESIRRISQMSAGVDVEPQTMLLRLLNFYDLFIEDFGRRNNHELEILTGDMADAITNRDQWEPAWVFAWPTYHGLFGVLAYNQWVEQSAKAEWAIARQLVDEH